MPAFTGMTKILALILPFLVLTSCGGAQPDRVDARDYDAFWLWAGVEPQPALDRAKTIYILAAEIKGAPEGRYVDLRPAVPRVAHARVWIVYRVETLDWDARVIPRILRDLERGKRLLPVKRSEFNGIQRGDFGHFSIRWSEDRRR